MSVSHLNLEIAYNSHMQPKVITARAIAAYAGRRSLYTVTMIVVTALAVSLAGTALLAYYFSPWWWVMAAPFIIIGAIFFVLRWIINQLLAKIYRHPFSRDQRIKLDEFAGKVMAVVEAKSTPPIVFGLITLWDIFRRRDATTLRKLINDSASLKSDFRELEKLFSE